MTMTIVRDGGDVVTLEESEPDPPAQRVSRKLLLVDARRDDALAAGMPVDGLHVALDDGSRADLGGMATTALASISQGVSWPESYQLGWITIENKRIPLPTAVEGMHLAAAAGDFYARIRQHARDLKDQIVAAAAADPNAIDIEAGWPES